MINGDVGDFVDRIYSCQDTVFIYNGVKYWFQGYMPSFDTAHMEVVQVDPERDGYVWEYNGNSISEGQESFQKAPIFEGKTFWDAEKDIEWTDE